VRAAVRAVGVNPIDWKVRSGPMAQFIPVEFPSVAGEEAAFVVDEVGDGINDAAVEFARACGARVIGAASAGNHEFLRTLGASDQPGLPRGQRASTPGG
jgi:NADPH:quinone reductase-like Zn-dependent oxidoreductase